jgi:predicted O-methyltransferase YrrM
MNISKAEAISGWMAPEELAWLAEQAEKYKLIVEIGSFRGRSTRALGDNTKGVVVAVDHWQGEAHLDMTQEERDKLFNEFTSNLSDLITAGTVVPVKIDAAVVDSTPVVAALKPEMVFIDGDHKFNSVKRDIQTWMPKIVSGGLLCGHDSGYPDVEKAITEFVPNRQLVQGTQIWYANI